ncbi:MAG: TVP38/TMEM64 family protein [Oscillospiraceae bacterium]|nr:TVP38/TMEM64 family protein [Oscillospiraceae bacterium]
MKTYAKPAAFVLIAAVILILDRRFGWSALLGDVGNLSFLAVLVRENLLQAALLYCLVTVVGCVVLALPGVTFAVLAGVLFGPWLGTLLCLVATTLGAVAAFLAGRFFLKDAVKPMVEKNRLLKKLLFEDVGRSDVVVLMITRLVPLFPYNLQNFAYGITDMRVTTYTLCTFLFMLPGVALFTVGTAGLAAEGNRWAYLAVAAALLALVLFLGWFIRKRFLGASAEK